MKKVLFFIRSLDAGGAERQLVIIAKGLAERGFHVTVLTFYSGGFYVGELLRTKVRLLSLEKKGRWDLAMFFYRLISVLRTESPDVVYSFLGVANILAVLVRFFIPNARIIWGIRSSNMDLNLYDWCSRWSYWLECKLARFADKVVANSHAGMKYAVEQGFPTKNMIVIANGIDTERFRPDKVSGERIRKSWGIGKDKLLIGLVGRIDPMKGHSNFLKAAMLVRQQLPQARFVCVGKGKKEYENAMRELASKMGLDDVLIWAEEYSDMNAVYNAFDIISSTSCFGEGFPNVIGEAMACGVPCVVTDVGDSALIVGQTGIVVSANESDALCSAWCKIALSETDGYRAKAIAARDSIKAQYSTSTLLESTEYVISREV